MRAIFALLFLLFCAPPTLCCFENNEFLLAGRLLDSEGHPVRSEAAGIFLQGALTPFSAQSRLGPNGEFTFKKLPAGTYVLIIELPRAGEMRKTVEVGPGLADSRRRIATTVTFDRALASEKESKVSAVELSVPENARKEYAKAEIFISRRNVEGAVACLQRAVEIAPQFAVAWNHLGAIAYQTRKFAEAEHYFREALKQDPEAYSPLVNLGGALATQGKMEESLPVNQAAVRAKPNDALAHSQLGSSYFFLGRLEEAETHLRRAKALDPGHFSLPQVTLIEIYLRTNRLSNAVAEMEEFLKLHPDSDWAPKIGQLLADTRAKLPSRP